MRPYFNLHRRPSFLIGIGLRWSSGLVGVSWWSKRGLTVELITEGFKRARCWRSDAGYCERRFP